MSLRLNKIKQPHSVSNGPARITNDPTMRNRKNVLMIVVDDLTPGVLSSYNKVILYH